MSGALEQTSAAIEQQLAEIEEERRRLRGALNALRGSTKGSRSRSQKGRRNGPAAHRAPRGQRQTQVLEALRRHPKAKPAELAREIGIRPQQVYAIVHKLHADGKIAKRDGSFIVAKRSAAKTSRVN